MPYLENKLFDYWKDYEKQVGRSVSPNEIAEAGGVSRDAVANLRDGKTKRYDEKIIIAICEYFNVPDGAPIPFLVYRRRE